MDDDLDRAERFLAAFLERCNTNRDSLNEADTRAILIDALFRDVLGWDDLNVSRELPDSEGGYLDYLFASDTNRFVLEAKRSGVHFQLPPRNSAQRISRENGDSAALASLRSALSQAVGYCRAEGVAVGVVSNGHQLAVTLAYDTPGLELDTLVYASPAAISANLGHLVELCAPNGSAKEHLERLLGSPNEIRSAPQYSRRLLQNVRLPDEYVRRNPLDATARSLVDRFFGDIYTGDGGVGREAYVSTDRTSSYGSQLDAILRDRLPAIGQPVEEPTERDSAVDEALREEAAVPSKDGVVHLIIGGVGAGKSTFIRRYFAEDAAPIRDLLLPVHLDFLEAPENLDDLSRWVNSSVLSAIEAPPNPRWDVLTWEALNAIYAREVEELRVGVLAPFARMEGNEFDQRLSAVLESKRAEPDAHVARCADYLRWRYGCLVILVFDNVDQFGEELQTYVLRMAYQKAAAWKTANFLTLREETYWRFRTLAPLDAYQRHVYHIAAPRLRDVLEKRVKLATSDIGDQRIDLTNAEGGVRFTNLRVGDFLKIIADSFFGSRDENALLIDMMAANDVRHGLDLFRTFLLSGHTNTDEYISAYMISGRYTVPTHALFRSISLGERVHFDSSKSLVENVFDIPNDGFYSHFQKLRVLRYLNEFREVDAVPARGFVPVQTLFDAFRGVVRDELAIRELIAPLLQRRLVEAANGFRTNAHEVDAIRLTSAGYYYLTDLVRRFSYIDLCATDTPILDIGAYDEILGDDARGQSLSLRLGDRIDRVRRFLRYLEGQEAAEQPLVQQASALSEAVRSPFMSEIIDSVEEEMRRIERSQERHLGDGR